MLDEQPVQLSWPLVEHVERPHLQDVAGIVEPGESRAKHRPDPARSGLAAEVDRLAADLHGHLHALLPQGFPAPDARRGEGSEFSSPAKQPEMVAAGN
jgi:hypothetical protein